MIKIDPLYQRVRKTDSYEHDQFTACLLGMDCRKRYCQEHRLLWRDCDTAKTTKEGDRDTAGGLHEIVELGECPTCEREAHHAEMPDLYR